MYRVLFLGQKPIGEKCFDYLINHCRDIIKITGVISNATDKVWWKTAGIYEKSMKLNIPFVPNDKKNNELILQLINETKPDLIICIQHAWILSPEILDAVNYFAFNLHNAKLPDYKGNNSFNHAILNQEKNYTCTIHWLANKVDMGDIAYEETFSIEDHDTSKSLFEKSYVAGQKLFKMLIDDLRLKQSPQRKKIIGEGTFYPRTSINNLREISSLNNESEVDLKSRAFFFPIFEKAYIIINHRKYFVIPEYNKPDQLILEDII